MEAGSQDWPGPSVPGSELLGGFSRAFDLIASEYGWRDEEILSLPLGRVRQIIAAISERIQLRERANRSVIEWQTKVLATYITGIAQSKEQHKALSKGLKKITMDPEADKNQAWEEGNAPKEGEPAGDKDLPSFEAIYGMFTGQTGGRGLEGPRQEDPWRQALADQDARRAAEAE